MIGLDTGHLVYNYGTKLQAYAMQTLLESSGEKCENMKARYSECHCRSEMSEAFVKDVNEIGFDEAVRKYIVKKDMIKERSRFQWLRIKRWIKRFLGILRR